MERQQNLTTIYWKEDYKNKLTDYIMKEEKTAKYLKNIIKYFEENNIEQYNNKVREFKKFMDTTKLNNIIDIYIYAREQD